MIRVVLCPRGRWWGNGVWLEGPVRPETAGRGWQICNAALATGGSGYHGEQPRGACTAELRQYRRWTRQTKHLV